MGLAGLRRIAVESETARKRGAAGWSGRAALAIRLLATVALLVCAGASAAGPASAAGTSPTFTWTGADTTAPSPNWSDPANWAGHAAPVNSSTVGTLSFPPLTSSDCTSGAPVGACYQSNNDLTALTVGALDLDGTDNYSIGGDGITLDRGLTTAPGSSIYGEASLNLPITLGAAQTWQLGTSLRLGSGLSGDHALTVDLGTMDDFTVMMFGDSEIGALSINGGQIELVGNLNATNGHAVTLTKAGLSLLGSHSVGALTSHGGAIQLGQPSAGSAPVTLTATRTALGSATAVAMSIGSELDSTSTLALGGATLTLDPQSYGLPCDRRPLGTVFTLVSASRSLTGTFGNAPEGSKLSDGCDDYEINYHRSGPTKTVTATLLGTPTTTSLVTNPESPVANQTATVTATVSSPGPPGTVAGTVSFQSGGRAIPGCQNVGLTFSDPTFTAACQTSFPAAASPVALSTTFTPQSGSDDQPSIGSERVTVAKAPTSTTLAVSETTPTARQAVTYTATVTPSDAGAVNPSGAVEFLDAGRRIRSCARRALRPASGRVTAVCTVRYHQAGTHEITATYRGDGNFTGSTSSPPQTVTVKRRHHHHH